MRTKIFAIGLGIMLVFVGLAGTGCTFSNNDDKKGSIYKGDQQQNPDNPQGQETTSQNNR